MRNTKLVEIDEIFCDVCGNKVHKPDVDICHMCGKDLCNNFKCRYTVKVFFPQGDNQYCKEYSLCPQCHEELAQFIDKEGRTNDTS